MRLYGLDSLGGTPKCVLTAQTLVRSEGTNFGGAAPEPKSLINWSTHTCYPKCLGIPSVMSRGQHTLACAPSGRAGAVVFVLRRAQVRAVQTSQVRLDQSGRQVRRRRPSGWLRVRHANQWVTTRALWISGFLRDPPEEFVLFRTPCGPIFANRGAPPVERQSGT